jgi:hypothetical protein
VFNTLIAFPDINGFFPSLILINQGDRLILRKESIINEVSLLWKKFYHSSMEKRKKMMKCDAVASNSCTTASGKRVKAGIEKKDGK